MQKVILCMKWGTLYGPEYVNVLHNAARRLTTGDLRFVCLRDDGSGLDDRIEIFPIPDIGLKPVHWTRGCWPKIALFLDDLYGLQGRALFIDLDMVLLHDLDGFFDHGEGLVMLDSGPWRYRDGVPRPMSSIFGFDLGTMGYMVDKLRGDRDALVARYDIEQDFIKGEARAIRFWPQSWVRSFKYHQRQPLILDRFLEPKVPAPETRVLCFHGRPRPIDLIRPPAGNWDVPPHFGRGQVPWMVEYWTANGGRV
ncbi:glycosyltransferase [Pseudotabrizicola formosa]|uniref:glycosyltransferase n=1 Tax=Pseudotabrizicola formosa TaxID=2030009 RepID=UPI000CD31404|nr:glycosyltransferase [Pseudotabrizicola formosa]